jgi:hypothetical protein
MGGVFVHHKKKKYQLVYHGLAISSVPSLLDFMDFKQHKTDITSINSIIKIQPRLGLLLTSIAVLLKKLLVISLKTFW